MLKQQFLQVQLQNPEVGEVKLKWGDVCKYIYREPCVQIFSFMNYIFIYFCHSVQFMYSWPSYNSSIENLPASNKLSEVNCEKYLAQFLAYKSSSLANNLRQRWTQSPSLSLPFKWFLNFCYG